ncbi:MAG: AMP-binding protein, partial [Proteobacteria bacterium]|nr:AMP-binding protein [Pseudomonadota bacterium]
MTSSLLWTPSQDQINQSNLKAFINYLKVRYDLDIKDYQSLYKWSIDECETFWKSIWDFCGLSGSNQSEVILENGHNIEKTKFFPHATLNFAQNLLKRRDHKIAIDFFGEDKRRQTLNYNELYEAVLTLQSALKSFGVKPYDRVVGYLPNMPHTVIAMLATTSLGAIWSGCSPDFGIQSVLDRFGQISPKILFAVDGYFYNGKVFSCVDKVKEIAKKIPSLEKVIFIPYINESLKGEKVWDDVLAESPYTRLLSKLTSAREFEGGSERRTGVYV